MGWKQVVLSEVGGQRSGVIFVNYKIRCDQDFFTDQIRANHIELSEVGGQRSGVIFVNYKIRCDQDFSN